MSRTYGADEVVSMFVLYAPTKDFEAFRPSLHGGRLSYFNRCALYSVVVANRRLRGAVILGVCNPPLVLFARHFREHGAEWSMQTDMVGRNAEAFNMDMGLLTEDETSKWGAIHHCPDYMPLGWRRSWWDIRSGQLTLIKPTLRVY